MDNFLDEFIAKSPISFNIKQMVDCKTSVVDVDQKPTCYIAKQAATS